MKNQFNISLIKKYIKDNNYSQSAFCKQCNISTYSLRKIFNNDFSVGIRQVYSVARTIKVDICDLII